MRNGENTFAMSQCMLTKQYGKYKAVIQFSAVDRPETEEKSSVADYGSLCGTPMRISELMLLHWFDRKNWTIFLRFGDRVFPIYIVI